MYIDQMVGTLVWNLPGESKLEQVTQYRIWPLSSFPRRSISSPALPRLEYLAKHLPTREASGNLRGLIYYTMCLVPWYRDSRFPRNLLWPVAIRSIEVDSPTTLYSLDGESCHGPVEAPAALRGRKKYPRETQRNS